MSEAAYKRHLELEGAKRCPQCNDGFQLSEETTDGKGFWFCLVCSGDAGAPLREDPDRLFPHDGSPLEVEIRHEPADPPVTRGELAAYARQVLKIEADDAIAIHKVARIDPRIPLRKMIHRLEAGQDARGNADE